MSSVDAFIQVRMASARVPGKALLRLGPAACLEHVVVRLQAAKRIRHVVVCTSDRPEDDPLPTEASRLGVAAYRGSLDNVIGRYLGAADALGTDVVVRVTGDSPLVDPGAVDGAVAHLLDEGLGYVSTPDLPVGTRVEVFTTARLRSAAVAAVDASRSEDLTYFVGRPELGSVGAYRPPAHLRRPELVLALNRPEDVPVLRAVLELPAGDAGYVSLAHAIRWLDAHPDVAAANADYVPTPTLCNTELDLSRLAGAGS